MNPDTQFLPEEIQKLSADQATIQKQLSDQKDLLERRFIEADEALDKRFRDADAAVEQRIIDSELRQDARLITIEKAASDLTSWHQEHEGIVDDLRLSKLDKYWNRSVIETTAVHVKPRDLPRSAAQVGAACHTLTCWLYGCSAQRAPRRTSPPGERVWGCHHLHSFPGHGYDRFLCSFQITWHSI